MKRLVYNDELDINVDIYFNAFEINDIAATTIKPVVVDLDEQIIDRAALEDFNVFLQNLFETITYYDFEILEDFKHTSKSFPYTSEYRWIAHRTEIDADNVPRYINLRVSEHFQNFSPERLKELSEQRRDIANKLKKPATKVTQRYKFENIVADGEQFKTYEEVLAYAEQKIFAWLKQRGVDVSNYDVIGW